MIHKTPLLLATLQALGAFSLPLALSAQNSGQGFFPDHYLLQWNLMLPLQYPRAYDFFNQVAAVQSGDRWGIIDREGNFVVEPTYTRISLTANGIYILSDNRLQGLFFPAAKKIIPAENNRIMGESDGIVSYFDGWQYGACDLNGDIIINPQFAMLDKFSEGLAAARKDEPTIRFGCIDRQGNWVIQPKFTSLRRFTEGKAAASLDGRNWGFIDHSGAWVIMPNLPVMPEPFENGFARVGEGYILANGKRATDQQATEARVVGDLCFFKVAGRWGWTDSSGVIRVPPTFDNVPRNQVSENTVAVQKNKAWGFADRQGNIRIEPQFSTVLAFQEGLAAAQSGDYWGYIDHAGKWVIPPQFASAGSFIQGMALVSKDDRQWLIDKNGNILRHFNQGVFFGRSGILTTTDVLTKSPKYSQGIAVFPMQLVTSIGYAEGVLHIGDATREGFLDVPRTFDGNTEQPEIFWGNFMEGDTLVLPAGLNGGIVACVCSATPPEAEWAVDGVAQGVATPLEKEPWACPYPARWMFRGEQGDGSVHAIRLRVRNASGQTESLFYYRLQ